MGLSLHVNDPAATVQDIAAILVRLSSDDAHAPTNDSQAGAWPIIIVLRRSW
jgi:hypothetical protein